MLFPRASQAKPSPAQFSLSPMMSPKKSASLTLVSAQDKFPSQQPQEPFVTLQTQMHAHKKSQKLCLFSDEEQDSSESSSNSSHSNATCFIEELDAELNCLDDSCGQDAASAQKMQTLKAQIQRQTQKIGKIAGFVCDLDAKADRALRALQTQNCQLVNRLLEWEFLEL